MTKAEYLHRAEECERMALFVTSEEHRLKILKIAFGWREMAESLESKIADIPRAA